MKRLLIVAAAALAIPVSAAGAQDYNLPPSKAASAACKAERQQMGEATFKQTYGTNKNRSNAFGKCVSKRTKTEKANQDSAAKACRAERDDANFAASHDGKTFDEFYGTGKNRKNAFGKCVSSKSKAASKADVKASVNAAKSCKADRKADATAFAAKWGTKRNAFGKCVSATAKEKQAEEQQA
ncbi:MAG TPA: hypothetical protein VM266_12175 [Solirubrobacteraceae bacterium]|nr:hypothetical protein [Solirubrobacteraceae bacterium]